MSILKKLNKDVLGVVLDHFTLLEQASLAQTCRTFLKMYKKKTTSRHREFYERELRRNQYVMAESFRQSTGVTAVEAVKGFGKTTLGLASCTEYTIIAVPSAVLKVWKDEVKEIGMFDNKPEKSDVLIYDPVMKTYMEYLKKDDFGDREKIIIIAKDTHLSIVYNILMKHKPAHADWSLIVDEAHKPKREALLNIVVQNPTRILLLSGSQMVTEFIRIKIDRYFSTDPGATMRASPTPIWIFEQVPGRAISDTRAVLEKIISENKKVVISITNNLAEALGLFNKVIVPGKKKPVLAPWNKVPVFRLLSSTATIRKFEESKGRGILVMNTISNEGLNISADCLIEIEPHHSNVVRCTQTAARIVRPTNQRKTVNIYFFTYSDEDVRRAFFTQVFANNYWKWGFDPLPRPEYLTKAMALIRLMGYGVKHFDPADACILMYDYSNPKMKKSELITWWDTHKGPLSVLTSDMIEDIYG